MRVRARAEEPIPPGWYQAPGEAFVDRYWDGAAWTEQSRRRATAVWGPPSQSLIETSSPAQERFHRVATWVATVLGAGLLIASPFTFGHPALFPGLLGSGGALIGSASMAVLREELPDRPYQVTCLAIGFALIIAGVTAAITVTAVAWFTTGCGIVLFALSTKRLLRRANPRSKH